MCELLRTRPIDSQGVCSRSPTNGTQLVASAAPTSRDCGSSSYADKSWAAAPTTQATPAHARTAAVGWPAATRSPFNVSSRHDTCGKGYRSGTCHLPRGWRSQVPMEQRSRIAHHEAAHAVIAMMVGLPAPTEGIDIDAENPDTGGLGRVLAMLFEIDDLSGLSGPELKNAQALQLRDAGSNLMAILAGAASDARLLGDSLANAMAHQPSDKALAVGVLTRMAVPAEDHEDAMLGQITDAARALDEPEIWAAVEAVAAAALISGRLSGPEIERVARPKLTAWKERAKLERDAQAANTKSEDGGA